MCFLSTSSNPVILTAVGNHGNFIEINCAILDADVLNTESSIS